MSWRLKEKYRAILSREEGYCKKARTDAVSVCLAYPNSYRAGMSNLGFQTVYDLFNRGDGCICERVFLPDREDEAELTRGDIPLFSLESQRPIADFDVIAFSLSFENDFPNILTMLALGGVSLLSSERKGAAPLILGGGIAVTLNPEPLADFLDIFILGEGEEVIAQFLERFVEGLDAGLGRGDILFNLQKDVEGVYVPRLYKVSYGADHTIEEMAPMDGRLPGKIKKRRVHDINAFSTEQRIVSEDTEFGEMYLIEVSRGCARGCRFCAAGFICRPARFRKADLLKSSFLRAIERQKKIGLLGTAVSDHPELKAMCRFIREQGGAMAIGSLRLDRLDPELLALLGEAGAKTLSLAPEAGSQRLRDVINKGIREEHIFRAVEMLAGEGILNIRLYFMVGIPTEEEEDVEAIIELIKKIKHRADNYSRGKRSFKRITLSINQFIPKAKTPFQWHPLADAGMVKDRIMKIKNAFRGDGTVRVIHDLPKWNYIQTLLSLGDRRVGEILLSVHRNGGNWPKAFKEVNINPDFYVYRQKSFSEMLPWDFIDNGVEKAFLLRECKKSYDNVEI